MMKFRLLNILFFSSVFAIYGQCRFTGVVIDESTSQPISFVAISLNNSKATQSDSLGNFEISDLPQGTYQLVASCIGYKEFSKSIRVQDNELFFKILMQKEVVQLSQIDLEEQNNRKSNLTRLRSVEGTSIYSSKKNEVILLDYSLVNKATNNSRQVYSKVSGLNIWESDGLGLQLEIGARGLSPSRTSNFNTRQNGYDISADALGYPESYYTPPTEAIDKIEIVRGAASLQYGTQFGGLLNFVLKEGGKKPMELIARQSFGSFNLKNTFISLGGTKNKWNYYGFYQKKSRNGWRENSNSEAQTVFVSVKFQPNKKVKLGLEYTHMDYLAKQPGGLDDISFESNPDTSFRSRNWFQVDWNIMALNLEYKFSSRTLFHSRIFGLWAHRKALGVLGRIDWPDEQLGQRDLLTAYFNNFGNESRLIHRYMIGDSQAALSLGTRIYRGRTVKEQGTSDGESDPNFSFDSKFDSYGTYFEFPSFNKAVFIENLVRITDCISITPGFRYDHITTESDGYFHSVVNDSLYFTYDDKKLERGVCLAGIGATYKCFLDGELYVNFSQNYRAINFNDMQVINSNIKIDPNLEDEKGFNFDLGLRRSTGGIIEYDLSFFYLNYSNRIGYSQQYYDEESTPVQEPHLIWTTYRFSTNIGDSRTLGLESYLGFNIIQDKANITGHDLNLFVNASFQTSKYIASDEKSLLGNKVEFSPDLTMKCGLNYKYKKFTTSLLYSHTSSQFSDAQNTIVPTQNALFGEIPAYSVVDISLKYEKKLFMIEMGVNNFYNESYFTRRATGYPGPGIIPSDKRNYYCSFQLKI